MKANSLKQNPARAGLINADLPNKIPACIPSDIIAPSCF